MRTKKGDRIGDRSIKAISPVSGMTELEEAELTTGQGKALSGHRSDRTYGGYARATQDRLWRPPASATHIG
jgi:hypothetical protein